MATKMRILVTPLDWGLGHASRCVPVINELIRQGAEPLLASSGRALQLLLKEFPGRSFVELPDYNIRYLYRDMVWNVAAQMPHVLNCIRKEFRLVQKIAAAYGVNGIISDNRFGCFSPKVKSVFITHQLNIQGPNPFFGRLGNAMHRVFIRRFDECWVPDFEDAPGLAGRLSHPAPFPGCRYIGGLSRLEPVSGAPAYELLILLSGPEPQRSKLEALLLAQAREISGRILLVQGKPEVPKKKWKAEGVDVVAFLSMKELSRVISLSKMIVCRSGYSTVMDLAHLGKRAIFIPTPGQTEQEYLARLFEEQGICYFQPQDEFNLAKALDQSERYAGFQFFSDKGRSTDALQRAISTFLTSIASRNLVIH